MVTGRQADRLMELVEKIVEYGGTHIKILQRISTVIEIQRDMHTTIEDLRNRIQSLEQRCDQQKGGCLWHPPKKTPSG